MGEKRNIKNAQHQEELEEERDDLLDKCNQIFIKIRSDFNLKFPTDQYVIFNRQYANHMKKEFDLFSMCLEEVYQTFEIDGEKLMSQFLNNILLTTKCILFTQLRCFLNYLDSNIQLNDSKPLSNWETSEMQKMSRHKVKVLRGTTDLEVIKAQESNLINDPSDEIKKRLGIEMDPFLRENQLSKKELLDALEEKRRNLSLRESKANRYIRQSLVGIKQQIQKEKTFVADFEEKYLQTLKKTIFQDGGQQVSGILDEITNNLDKNAKQKLVKVLEFLFNSTKEVFKKSNIGVQTTLMGNAIDESEGKMVKLSRKIYDQDRSIEQLLKESMTKDSKIVTLEKELFAIKNKNAKDIDTNQQFKAEELQKQLDKINKQLNEALEDKSYYQAQLANARKEESNKSSFMGKNNKNSKSNAQSSNNSSQQQQSQQQESQKSSLQQKSQGQSQQQQQLIPSQGSLQTQNDEQFQSQPGQQTDKNKGLTINTKSPNQTPISQIPSSSKLPLPSSKHSNKNNSGNLPSFQDLSGAHSPSQSISNLLSPQVASKTSAQQVTQSPILAQPGVGTAGLAESKQKAVFFSDKNTVGSPQSNYFSQNEGYLQLKQTNQQTNQLQDYLDYTENQQQVKTTQQISQQQSNQKYSSIQQTAQIISSSQTNLQIQEQPHHSRENSSNISSVVDSPVREKPAKNEQQSPVIVKEELTNKQQQTIVNTNQVIKQKHKGNGNTNNNKQVKQSSEHNETSYISGASNQTATHRSTNHHQYESSPVNVIPDEVSKNNETKDQTNNQSISQPQVQQHQQSKSQQLQSSIVQEQSEVQKSSTQSNKSSENTHSQQKQSQQKQFERNPSQIRQPQKQQNSQVQNQKSQQHQEGSHNESAQVDNIPKSAENKSQINNAENLIRESKKQNIPSEKNIISSSRLSELVQSQTDLNLKESSVNTQQTQQQHVNIRINQSEEQPEDLSNLSYSRTRNSLVDSEQTKGQSYFQQQQHLEDNHDNYIKRDSEINVNNKETLKYQQRESLFNHDISSVLQSTVINSVSNIGQISSNANNNQISTTNLGSIGVLTSSDNLGGLSQNVLPPENYLQGNTEGNNFGNPEGQKSNFGNTFGGFQRGSDGDISSSSNNNNNNNTKYSSRVDVKEFLDLFDLENGEPEQPSQSTQILEVLRNKRNPKRREVINAIVEVINKKKTNQSKESQNKQQIRSESIRQEEGEEEEEEENLDQQGQKNRKNLHLTEKKKKKVQNSSGFTSSDQGQLQNKNSTATATSLSSTAVLIGIQENTNDTKNQDVFSGDNLSNQDKGFFKNTPQNSNRADTTNRSNISNNNNNNSGQASYFEDERGKYEKQSSINKNNKLNNNGSANNLDRYLQYPNKGLSETDRGRRNYNNTSPQSDQLVSEAKLKKQYLTQVTFKDANKAQKQSQKQLPQDNQLANFEEDPDVLARLVQKQEVIQDVQRKKNQIAMSRFQAQGDLSSSSTFYEKSRGSQITVNGSSSLTNIDGKQSRSQAQTMWKQKDEFRIIDPKASANLFNGGQISSTSKLDSIDTSRKNTNPSRTQGTIYKKPPPFNEDEHFVKDLYEHMKIGQIDLSQLKELDMQGGSVPRIQQRDEQPSQPNIKVLNSGRVVDTNNIRYDEFADYYSDVLQQHRRCGPFCYHLKRFYEKLNFNVKAYQNRQAIQCPTLVVQELQRENKKQPAKFNLKNPSTHI